MKLKVIQNTILSDLYTPVGVFLKLRDQYANVVLLESSEYASKEGSYSFIACDELSGIEVNNHVVNRFSFEHKPTNYKLQNDIVDEINGFLDTFTFEGENSPFNGLFGYSSFESIKYFEKSSYHSKPNPYAIPDIKYSLYRFIIVFDHFRHKLTVVENCPLTDESKASKIFTLINKHDYQTYGYKLESQEKMNMSDEAFMAMVTKCKEHCKRGDVFQIVPSRRYSTAFSGDEFNVYRNLRSINPSPYLFYFDYVSYKLFGSSPEAQIIIKNNEAEVHPIAGTIKRSPDPIKDEANTKQLLEDPKENSEHIMLVDLARNDLSKSTTNVHVASYREVQYFSHVIHLVSKVKGTLKKGISAYKVFADTFPQGTLSGAPKIEALKIIENLEPHHRGHYGGAIGMIGFDNTLNHAIVIRSILSQNGELHLQAGAGVVIDSKEEFELKEVNNKLGALKVALAIENN
jgi:anthranilate synthase component I